MKEYVKSLVARESARHLAFGSYIALQHTSAFGSALCCRVVASPFAGFRVVPTTVTIAVFREVAAAAASNEFHVGS